MKSKEKGQNSRSKQKKKLRDTNSYKIQFKVKAKNNKEKKINKLNSKKTASSNSISNISVKTYNQKPNSSIIKEYNNQIQNKNNNNAISYSNYAFPEMEQSKKIPIQNNELCESSKFNNEDYNYNYSSLANSKSNNNKMDVNDLSINTKVYKNNYYNINDNNDKDLFQNDYFNSNLDFSKRAAYSLINDNLKRYGNNSYNFSKFDKNPKHIYETSLKRLDDKLKLRLEHDKFNKIQIENKEQLEQQKYKYEK